VYVDSGGAAGTIALYVFSSGTGKDLQIAYRNQRLYRALISVNPGPAVAYSVPIYSPGDELCCPSAYRQTTLKWSSKHRRFGVAQRRTITP
jgi:hypothetical protein